MALTMVQTIMQIASSTGDLRDNFTPVGVFSTLAKKMSHGMPNDD